MAFDDFETSLEDFGSSTTSQPTIPLNNGTIFLPWHKPRKQWIRVNQWWKQIERNLINNPTFGTDTIKYFGLPGKDLLDIRYFEQQLSALNKKICLLGLINNPLEWKSAQAQLSKIYDLIGIDEDSTIERLDFDNLLNYNTIGYSKIKKFEYFHIVNLDFCSSITPISSNDDRLRALEHLIHYQLQQVPNNWLLFITTRTSKETSNSNSYEELIRCIDQTLTNDIFYSQFIEVFSDVLLDERSIDRNNLEDQKFINMFIVGLFNWISKNSHALNFDIKLSSIACYDIQGDNSNDMISMCFTFKKSLSTPSTPANLPTFIEMNVRALDKIKRIIPLDNIINTGDINIYKSIVKQQMNLLDEAGYDTTHYVEQMCSEDLHKFSIDTETFLQSLE